MKLLDLVKQRYSCRSYLEKSVEQEFVTSMPRSASNSLALATPKNLLC